MAVVRDDCALDGEEVRKTENVGILETVVLYSGEDPIPEMKLLLHLTTEYPDARIIGHCELPHVTKDCPCFVASEYYALLQPERRG